MCVNALYNNWERADAATSTYDITDKKLDAKMLIHFTNWIT